MSNNDIDNTYSNSDNQIIELKNEIAKLKEEILAHKKQINNLIYTSSETDNLPGKPSIKNENFYRNIVEMNGAGFVIVDLDGNFIEYNNAFCKMCGYTKDEMKNLSIKDIQAVQTEEVIKQNIEKIKNEGTALFETVHKRKNGEEWIAEVSVSYYPFNGGIMVSFMRDITDKKNKEKSLKEQLAKEKTLRSAIPDLLFLISKDLIIKDYSSSEEAMLYTPPEVFKNKRVQDVLPTEVGIKFILNTHKAFETQAIQQFEYSLNIKGEEYFYEARIKADNENEEALVVIRDITKTTVANKKIFEQEELYQKLVKVLDEGVRIIGIDGNIIWMNDKQLKIYGVDDLKWAEGEKHYVFISQNELEKFNSRFMECLLKGKTESEEFTLQNAKGNQLTVEESSVVILNENNEPKFIVSIMKDISESKENLNTINRLSLAIEQTIDTIFITNKDGNIEYVNKSLLNAYGYSKEELYGKNPKLFKSGIKDKEFYNRLWKTILGGEVFRAEVINKKKDGTYIFEDRNITPLRDKNGEITHFLSIGRDITERKLAEIKINKSEKKYSSILRTALDGFLIHDTRGKILEVNDTFCKISGFTREELLIKKISDLFLTTLDKSTDYYIKEVMDKGALTKEIKLSKSDKSISYLEINAMVNEFEDKNVIMFLKDITERKRIMNELIEAKENAENMNKLKTNFLANMSHELRTPLIGVIGYAEIMRDQTEDLEQKELADTIFVSGQRLLRTLNLILDISRLESDKNEIIKESLDVSDLIYSTIKLYKQEIENKKLTLEVFCNIKNNILSDKRLLNTIINNLLNNAVKFTKNGKITIISEIAENNNKDKLLSIKVKDTGIGIDAENQSLIFDDFRQASEGLSRLHEGLGLGLAVSQKYAKLLNGKIELLSKLGEGSTFVLTIPVEEIEQIEKTEKEQTELKGLKIEYEAKRLLKILLVDDDVLVHNIIPYFVRRIGTVDSAFNMLTTLEKIKEVKYDLILMDINLSDKYNGIDVLKAVREFESYKNVPVIACTAYAMDSDKRDLLEQGFTDYLSKPYGAKNLQDKIAKIF